MADIPPAAPGAQPAFHVLKGPAEGKAAILALHVSVAADEPCGPVRDGSMRPGRQFGRAAFVPEGLRFVFAHMPAVRGHMCQNAQNMKLMCI